jgi:adenylyl-sulfate kinase
MTAPERPRAPRPTPEDRVIFVDPGLERETRWRTLKLRGATMLFTGLSGSGKSTITRAVEAALVNAGVFAYRLDGDNVRRGLNNDLGFSPEDRSENVRRLAEAAALLADAGAVVLVSAISPYAADRAAARAVHQREGLAFLEVFVDAPLEVCQQRDPKGLYKKAKAGEIRGLTGVDAPYERPSRPDLALRTGDTAVCESVAACLARLRSLGIAPPASDGGV